MLVHSLTVAIDSQSMEKTLEVYGNRLLFGCQNSLRGFLSSFKFNRRKKLIQVSNDIRVGKWPNLHFWVN